MSDVEKIKRDLFSGKKAGAVKDVVNSKEGRSVGKMIDGDSLKKALAEGDSNTMQSILNQVLATDDGKALVKQISERFEK